MTIDTTSIEHANSIAQMELQRQDMLQHPGLNRTCLVYIKKDGTKLTFINKLRKMQLMSELIDNNSFEKVPYKVILNFFQQLLKVVMYLNETKLHHGNLIPQVILIDESVLQASSTQATLGNHSDASKMGQSVLENQFFQVDIEIIMIDNLIDPFFDELSQIDTTS